jgi:hypothetical protein
VTTHPREIEDEQPDYPTDEEWRAMQELPDDMWCCSDEEACARLAEIWFGGESK